MLELGGRIAWYLFVAVAVCALDLLINVRYFYKPTIRFYEKAIALHGEYLPQPAPEKSGITFVFFVVLFEEAIFRGPVLMALSSGIVPALVTAFPSAIIFGLVHLTNKLKFSDGTELRLPSAVIVSIGIGGFLYGLSVVLTKSIIPAIGAHFLFNMSLKFNRGFLLKVANKT